MHVSVAICTWNRADLLAQTLERFTKMAVPDSDTWELVLVDNNSTDRTVDVVAAFASRLPITPAFEPAPGLAHARNRALAVAEGDLILWTDDDVLVDEQWLEAFVACARRHPGAVAFGGAIEPWFVSEPDPLVFDVFPSVKAGFCGIDHGPVERELAAGEGVHGANFAIRRAAARGVSFDVALGHSPTSLIGGEETEFVNAMRRGGGTVVWCPQMRVRHYVAPERLETAYLRRYMMGRGRRLARTERVSQRVPARQVPRWVYRRMAESSLASVWHGLRGRPREALASRRDAWVYTGMWQEYRQ
jgi:glycosyltransferase involved in cell wall biosynthesis